ncbi:MAG: poly-gamma-glutamate system protein, partial [Gammaproteobacteria bacterium]|nr:poly-gamma-glutamate system protein [Gammaproteobacteria bacterium]
ALNLALYSAMEQLGARPLVIVSGSASQWGANVPGLNWLDMSRELRAAGLITTREIAASLGGAEDRGIGVSERGHTIIKNAIKNSGLQFLMSATLEESVAKRIALYTQYAYNQPIRAYINIAGGSASTGPASIDQYFEGGVITSAQPKAFAVESVMGHFLQESVPVINLSGIATIARRYGLPLTPMVKQSIGSGGVYNTASYRTWLAGFWIIFILILLYMITRISGVVSSFDKGDSSSKKVQPTI